MSEVFAGVNGHSLTSVKLTVGNTGPWYADCDFDGEADGVEGAVTLTIGTLQLKGTVDPTANGVEAGQRKARIVAGGGGWAKPVSAKNYHNDARVKARTVAEDAAREVGETIGTFVPTAERVGVDYVREVGPASRVIEDVIGGAPWWVDYEGVTQVGSRPGVAVDDQLYEVLAYDPRDHLVTLGVDDPSVIQIGSIVSKNLPAPQTVRGMEITVTAGDLRVSAWCGGTETSADRLPGLMRAIVERASDGRLWGKYRYRVLRMNGDRVELQAVRQAVGLPDVMPVSLWPGVAGAHAKLQGGSEVLVEFIEGDRTLPIITHFAGADGVGHVPVELVLLGGTQAAARQGDLVQSGGPGTSIIITGVGAAPNNAVVVGVPYTVSFSSDPAAVGPLAAPLYGAIATGRAEVKI